jgi:transposase
MGEISTIGLDIAKSVFQIHGVDVDGAVVIRKRISRAKLLEFFAMLPACLVGIEGVRPHIIGAAGFRRLATW